MPSTPKSTAKSAVEPPPVRIGAARGKGRGVYAARRIRKGEIIERAPVVVMSAREWREARKTVLDDYAFEWGPDNKETAIVLGYGSLYNHSKTPNARWFNRLARKECEFVAIRDIEEGEEICTNYNGDPEDQSPLWFERNGR